MLKKILNTSKSTISSFTVSSDMWAAYQNIPGLPQAYQHFTVNHSQNFVDPVTNACTNHVEVCFLIQIFHKS